MHLFGPPLISLKFNSQHSHGTLRAKHHGTAATYDPLMINCPQTTVLHLLSGYLEGLCVFFPSLPLVKQLIRSHGP